MTHYCYVIVASDGDSRLIALEPDVVFGPNWRDQRPDAVCEWEQINKKGSALGHLLNDGWTPLRETAMAPEWTKSKTGVSHSLAVLQKEQ